MKRALQSMMLATAMVFGSVPAVDAASDNGGPTRPDLRYAIYDSGNDHVYLDWNPSSDPDGVKGYNIYKNNYYVSSVSGTNYVDELGTIGDRYYVVAYDRSSPANFSDHSVTWTSINDGSTSSGDDVVNDRPSTPLLTPRASSWRKDHHSPYDLNFVFFWEYSTDDQGIAGYNIYINGQYETTRLHYRQNEGGAIAFSPSEVEPGDRLSVVAFDYHVDRGYSNGSQEFLVPPIPPRMRPPGLYAPQGS